MKKKLTWKRLVGQRHAKEMLAAALSGDALGHAYLFCGDPGTGAFQAALELSMALLCSNDGEAPCYECEACQKALRNAHPDFHVILPVCLEKEHKGADGKLSRDGWNFLSESALKKIADPYGPFKHPGIPSIPVEWVKEVNHAVARGPVSAATAIVLIDGVDIMNKESANAMLKTLEEPPPGTLIICITARPHAVLSTIVSRCQTVRFGWAPPDLIREAVGRRYGASVTENIQADALRYCGGSLGRAFDLCENPPAQVTDEAKGLLEKCANGDWLAIAARVDALARGDYESCEQLFLHLIYRIRSEFLQKIVPSTTYFDDGGVQSGGGENRASSLCIAHPETASRCMAICQEALAGVRAYGNVSIILVNCLFSFMEIMHEQKQ